MKTKFSRFLTFVFALLVPIALVQAQAIQISGTVTDEGGIPIPGVNITVVGTDTGTNTDFDGNYALAVEQGQTLLFSSIGFQDQEVTVGIDTTIDVTLKEGTALDEVVVTALGITREKRSLGYSTQEVKSDEINRTPMTNFTNALSGKVAGLNIKQNNNFGGSTNVVLRGVSSMTGNNQALFVVDGVPISNQMTNTKDQQQAVGTSYDYGNAAADINPEDIESVNVLKGAAAAALYGNRAANGVIEITTKSGKRGEGMGVVINSSVDFGIMDRKTFPTYQNEYGAGYGGDFDLADPEDPSKGYVTFEGDDGILRVSNFRDDGSYGPAFDGELTYQWDAFDPDSPNYLKATPWVGTGSKGPYKFFETPVTLKNSVALSGGGEHGSYRLSYTNTKEKGSMPNMDALRNDIRFNGNFDLTDKLHAKARANYIKSSHTGRNSTGYNDNILSLFRQWWETNVDIEQQKDIFFQTDRNVTWNPNGTEPGATPLYWDNPYWTRYKNYQNDSRSRFLGNVTLDYDVTDWLTVTGRAGTDTYNELQEERRAVGSVAGNFGVARGNVDSGYLRRDITFYENNFDLLLKFNAAITDKLDFNGLLGGSIRRNNFNEVFQSTSGGLLVPDLYSLQNGVNPPPNPKETAEKTGTNSFYGQVSFGYDNMLFLDATLRQDEFSTLPTSDNSIWYPSVSTSWVFSELMGNRDVLSFGKFRINYGEVGNDASFDQVLQSYRINNDAGASRPDSYNNANLKPERKKTFETGLDMEFFNRRVGFDFAYYESRAEDQIINAPVVTTTGYSSKLLNAGTIRNRGVELTLTGSPVRTEDWEWNIAVNWSKDESKVMDLPEGTNSIILGSFQGGVTIEAIEGKPFGVIRGKDYIYHENGSRLIDDDPNSSSYGRYLQTAETNKDLGDTNPDWKMGISNSVSWKNLSFSFLIDWQKGGNVFSLDQYYGEATGLYPNSAGLNDRGGKVRDPLGDNGGYLNKGVLSDGSPNTDIYVNSNDFGEFGYQGEPHKAFVYDASFIKLREVAITYDLPQHIFQNTFIEGIRLGVTGNNLWLIHKNIPYADPEAGLGAGNLQGYITGAYPTFRRIGFNARIQF